MNRKIGKNPPPRYEYLAQKRATAKVHKDLFPSSPGTKAFTVFAPTDAAFVEAATKNAGTPIWQEADGPEAAKEIVLRHVIPTTLYTAGMRYYHQKETLRQQVPIQIQKTGGKCCLP